MSKAAPQLSIIMPMLNEGAAIVAALQALQPLRQGGVEIIVVDGGSTDGGDKLARPLVDRLLPAPPGRARQMNAGAAAATSAALLFLHADSRLPPQAEQQVLAALHMQPSRPCWGRFDVSISGASKWLPLIAFMMNWRSRLSGVATGDQAIFMNRAAFDAVGGYAEIPLMEDIVISKALRRLAPPHCLRPPLTTSGRRWLKGGVWRTIWLMWRLRARFFCGADPARLAAEYAHVRDND